jgi:hypothetical protein
MLMIFEEADASKRPRFSVEAGAGAFLITNNNGTALKVENVGTTDADAFAAFCQQLCAALNTPSVESLKGNLMLLLARLRELNVEHEGDELIGDTLEAAASLLSRLEGGGEC